MRRVPPLSPEGEAACGELTPDPLFFGEVLYLLEEYRHRGCPGGGGEKHVGAGTPRSDFLFL